MTSPRPAADQSPAAGSASSREQGGRRYWRSLDEVKNTPEFEQFLHREFPEQADEPVGFDRRRWLQLMGASLALAGVTGCRWENEQFLPMATGRSAGRLPGLPQLFATSWELDGVGRSLLVSCVDGRPVKIEGNAEDPNGRGAASAFDQALILNLYDPDRQGPVTKGVGPKATPATLDDALAALNGVLGDGAGSTAVLCEATGSPTLKRLRDRVTAAGATWCEYSPLSGDLVREGTRQAFGDALRPSYDLAVADVIVCLDADPLGDDPASSVNNRAWASRRRPEDGPMNRLYAIESQFSVTGAAADHRFPIKSTAIPAFLAKLGAVRAGGDAGGDKFLAALAEDLRSDKKCVVLCGSRQPAAVQAYVHRLNEELGNHGVSFLAEADAPANADAVVGIQALCERLREGEFENLIVLGGNPAYDAPADCQFAKAVAQVKRSVRVGVYRDETSLLCGWHVPMAHPLEQWGDVRLWDGSYAIQQPLIQPLFGGVTSAEFLARLLGEPAATGYELTRATFDELVGGGTSAWKTAVHRGFVEGSAGEPASASVSGDVPALDTAVPEGFELVLTPSSSVHDGRFANNGWLQEAPDFLTKLVWDNAALISPVDAAELGVEQGDGLIVTTPAGSIDVPAYILAGQAKGSIGLALGYGRTAAGIVGGNVGIRDGAFMDVDEEDQLTEGVGFDAYPLWRTAEAGSNPHVIAGVKVAPGTIEHELVTTQNHHAIDERGMEHIMRVTPMLVREATEAQFAEHPDFADKLVHHPPLESLWESREYTGRSWGMAIDLAACTGCNACTVACQAENNVPVVGKDQVKRGREMHWLRMDRYFTPNLGGAAKSPAEAVDDESGLEVTDPAAWMNPAIASQPMMCVHCENAPCEQVCPVAATVHTEEGLNAMVYNRCIGTRYCSNNCPYKVRRFNFLNYNKRYEGANKQLTGMVLNPEVSVRVRGVMEKCTYCVQRIQHVTIPLDNANEPLKDGMIQTACGQACPTGAIVFGDLNDENSRVRALHQNGRAYKLLSEYNTKPRTAYLARIRNPHPDLEQAEAYYRDLSEVLHDDHGAHGHDDAHGGHGERAEGSEHDPHRPDDDPHGHEDDHAAASRLLNIVSV
ncbi:TAT-variant-translocated molybdopterin oxidoreductase [Alienimonas californiensis]|uniref:Tetrathionate reductase subunit B n=1 Tax=Alienimonas californiensis TaxID=2527989 RepID=A0A517PBT4_9PLAN|nr:TAT-variant-translocated molybdopterin oxidoreductase [Alienimonas californiensis]QDT16843.1 Tetrathionate reductase subunit B precursor [Alienimonas californiensis]